MSWVRNGKFFAVKPTWKASIPQAKRATGFEKEAPAVEYFNQALEEAQRVDYILGSAADLTLGNANVKWNGASFEDEAASPVVFIAGDRIAIVSFDGGAVTFSTSNLWFDMDPNTEIDLTSITFTLSGAGCRGRLNFTNAPDNSIILSGSNSLLDIRSDNFEAIVNTGENDFWLNGKSAIQSVPNFENDYINSSNNVAQRGTSFLGVADGTYTLDRMKYRQTGTMSFNVVQQSVGSFGEQAIRATCATAQASLGVNDFAAWEHIIEGYNVIKYYQNGYAAVSIRVQSNITGQYFVAFQNSGNDRSYISSYTINSASTKETKTFIIPIDELGGTWDFINGAGLRCFFVLAAGTGFEAAAETWVTGDKISETGGGINIAANTSDYLEIDQIKIRPGTVQTGFFAENYDIELQKSSRYAYDYANGRIRAPALFNSTTNLTRGGVSFFPSIMRGIPVISGLVGNSNLTAIVADPNVTENSFSFSGISTGAGLGTWLTDYFSDAEL
jgi:hypothetical protein